MQDEIGVEVAGVEVAGEPKKKEESKPGAKETFEVEHAGGGASVQSKERDFLVWENI